MVVGVDLLTVGELPPLPTFLHHWLSDQLVTFSGGRVDAWEDTIGGVEVNDQGNNARRPLYIASDIGGLPAVRFEGPTFTNVLNSGAGAFPEHAQPITYCTVVSAYTSTATYRGIILTNDVGAGKGHVLAFEETGGVDSRLGATVSGGAASTVWTEPGGMGSQVLMPTDSGLHNMVWGLDEVTDPNPPVTTLSVFYLDGVRYFFNIAPDPQDADDHIRFGASAVAGTNPIDCTLHEIIVGAGIWTVGEVAAIQAYISDRY